MSSNIYGGCLEEAPPKYQYHVATWGGFYNDNYRKIHGLSEGDFLFDTKKLRDEFIKARRKIESDLKAWSLCFTLTEGFCCNIKTVLHRVISYKGKTFYTYLDLGVNYEFSAAKYHLQWKWYPGFNDYPLGEDFNYSKVKIIKQWITGAFQDTANGDSK